jgi:hypothetical protein
MASETSNSFKRVLDPIDRISEILFGLIMVLTSTRALNAVTAGRPEIQTLIIGALGCNLAWGIIDAGMYLMSCLDERGRNLLMVRAVRQAKSADDGRRLIADALPELLASALSTEELESMRQKLCQLAKPPVRAGLTAGDVLGAAGVCLLVFLSTFPVVIPFFFAIGVQPALLISNAVAIVMLFLCGYAFGWCTGHSPWLAGLLMIAIGAALVGVAVALGG